MRRRLRVLAIMGSGETSPTMVTIHKEIVARLGAGRHSAVLLDTPYAFQENAADISVALGRLLRPQRRTRSRLP